jgi:iron(III) transport system ATP-binding protein
VIDSGFEFVDVSKCYSGKPALAHVSMRIPVGPHTAILGPSGCGKSTVLRLLAGLEQPTTGSILLNGQTLSTAQRIIRPPHERGIAMLFQDLALWPNLTTRENIRLGLAGLRLTRQESSHRLREALELCGIADLADRYPSQLSGGQQQRAALARAIAVQPRFLLLDEPFSSIDLGTKSRLLGDIADLARNRQFQVVLVSHDPAEALTICENAILLDQGTVQASGKLGELLSTSNCEPFVSFRRIQTRFERPEELATTGKVSQERLGSGYPVTGDPTASPRPSSGLASDR